MGLGQLLNGGFMDSPVSIQCFNMRTQIVQMEVVVIDARIQIANETEILVMIIFQVPQVDMRGK